jgi:hypothetical protein
VRCLPDAFMMRAFRSLHSFSTLPCNPLISLSRLGQSRAWMIDSTCDQTLTCSRLVVVPAKDDPPV